ncbi:uncharacterized protein EV154DRAFT_531933 [Mucor mucedo]|uniref:uncharacterized protein n=1 Tax=Mucor mucedo TaxID=29922 RepID=UPI00221EF88C|nr:uncharacterized protein EV154DRAFT_531933 [Mucor mucedo]KAI7867604.1 hypothetical protein EV154DRAFT_531933 [Mucor mucedo]
MSRNTTYLPRSSSYSSRSNKSSLTVSSSSSSSFVRGLSIVPASQQPNNTMSSYSEYSRPPSYYSSSTSDNDRRYQQTLPDIPSFSSAEYYKYNNATSPRLYPSSAYRVASSYRDDQVDTKNSYVDETIPGGKIDPYLSTSTNDLVFPPTPDMIQKTKMLLLETEESFTVIYAGDAIYKPDKGILNKTKKCHFVLTDNFILLYKNSQKARSEINFFDLADQSLDNKTLDKDRIFLKLSHIYAVHAIVATIQTAFRIEYFHPQSNQALHHILTVDTQKECRQWIQALRQSVKIHHPRITSLSPLERNNVIDRLTKQSDHFPKSEQIKTYKVVFKEKRYKAGSDTAKEVFLPMIFAIGKFSFYFLPVSIIDDEYLKMVERDRFGLLSITSIKYEDKDDTIVLEVKQVDKNNRQLVFASSFCEEIIQNLQRAVDSIFPHSSLFTSHVPPRIKNTKIIPFQIPVDPEDEVTGHDDEEMHRFSTTLRAFTAAMNLNKSRLNYSLDGASKLKVFTLLPPSEISSFSSPYQKYELLCIFRTLQVNNIFVEVCFANHTLHCLESWRIQTNQGWTENTTLRGDNILSNEIYDLLTNLSLLRKLDLSNCSIGNPIADTQQPIRRHTALSIIGTVMSSGKTNISRIRLGENKMAETDLRKLTKGIKEHKKSIKELDLNDCGLEKDLIELVLKTLYEKNPDQIICLDLSSSNGIAIHPDLVQKMIHSFRRLRVLRMRGYNLLGMDYNFQLESSHLQELDLGGSRMNGDIVNRLCQWIQSPSFQSIEALHLGDCNLNGKNVHHILQSISLSRNRDMHLNLERNPIMKEVMHLPTLYSSILQGEGPKSLSLARIEWDDSTLREWIDCLRDNQTISHLDLSDISMRDTDEISEDTVRILTSFFERNRVMTELKLNLQHTIEPLSPFFKKSQFKSVICKAIIQALHGLRHNSCLRHIDLSGLRFGDEGALALARVLNTNRTLQSICLDENHISIEGYRKLKTAIEENATQIIYLPIPRKDIRFQLQHLTFRIEDLIISENESQFFLIHTTASDSKKMKRHELEMIIQERRICEASLKNLEGVMHAIAVVVRKNVKEYEEQNYRNREFQLQSQNATDELSMAQVRLQQTGRSFSGTNLSAVGVLPRPRRNLSSSNASTTSSTNSSICNSVSSRRGSDAHYQQNIRRSVLASNPFNNHSSYYQNGDSRMYLSRNINSHMDEGILGKPHSYDSNQMLQSPITPSMEYPGSYYQYPQADQAYADGPSSPDVYSMDDPGFISDFGYADDYEQEFFESNHPRHMHQQKFADQSSTFDEDIVVEKLNRVMYLPPDSRD